MKLLLKPINHAQSIINTLIIPRMLYVRLGTENVYKCSFRSYVISKTGVIVFFDALRQQKDNRPLFRICGFANQNSSSERWT